MLPHNLTFILTFPDGRFCEVVATKSAIGEFLFTHLQDEKVLVQVRPLRMDDGEDIKMPT
jgi:hypothetical protein